MVIQSISTFVTNIIELTCYTSVQVINNISICPAVRSTRWIWCTLELYYVSTTTIGSNSIAFSIAIAKSVAVNSFVTVAILIVTVVSIGIEIDINNVFSIVISIAITISIVVDADTGFHL